MMIRPLFSAVALVLALLVGATGVASAVQRAPDRDMLALEVFQRAHAIALADLCGSETTDKHGCPLCHGLPHTAEAQFAAISFLLTPHDAWPQLRSLQRAAQGRNINHSPRAPPVLA